MSDSRKILFLFLDGVGLGEDDPAINPFSSVPMPNLEGLLGGHRLVASHHPSSGNPVIAEGPRATLLAVDACLGVEGLPQSATGQAALLTGKNVPAWLGEHEGPKPTQPIAELLRQGSLFTQLKQQGRTVDFLNAYPPRYFESIERDYRLPGVIALSAKEAGLELKTWPDLQAGQAISADLTGQGWRTHLGYTNAPVLSTTQAGERLMALSGGVDLAVFEYWLTDVAGHHQDAQQAADILLALEAVLGSLATGWDDEASLILVTSDHGNLEDLRTRHHTRNDVPLLFIGSKKLREVFLSGIEPSCRSKPDLTDIAPAILRFIG